MVAADSVLKRVLFLALRQDEVGSAAAIREAGTDTSGRFGRWVCIRFAGI